MQLGKRRPETASTTLRWEQLDPEFTRNLMRSAPALFNERSPAAVSPVAGDTAQVAFPQPSDLICSLFAGAIATLVVSLYVSICFHWGGPGATLLLIALPAALLVMAHRLPHAHVGSRAAVRLRGKVTAPLRPLLIGSTGSELTPTERLYGEIVTLVSEAPASTPKGLPPPVGGGFSSNHQRVLRECGVFLAMDRRLERAQAHLAHAHNYLGAQRSQADSDITALKDRCRAESDPIARAALEESLSLAERRAEILEDHSLLAARINARRELIRQSLLFVLALLGGDPAHRETLAAPDTRSLREAAESVARESRAIEAAIAELSRR